MRPLTAFTGFLLGSCVAITISLAMVLIVFVVLGDDYPRLQAEFRPLALSLCIFVGMTAVSAGSFYTLLINHRLWPVAHVSMWAGLVATGWYYWP